MNQIKAILTRFGIRTFRPTLRKAEEKLEGLRTAEGAPLLENTRAELRRHLARLSVVREQDPCDRAQPSGQARNDPRERPARDGPSHCARPRRRCRDGGHAGQRGPLAPLARSQGCRSLCRPHRLARTRAANAGARKVLREAGNARVRCGMIQLAWRFLRFQKDSALAQWYRGPNGRWARRHAQDDDRGAGAKAAHRPLAPRHDGRGTGWRRLTSGVMSDNMEQDNGTTSLAAHARVCR